MPRATRSGGNFVDRLHEWQPLISALVSSVVTITIAIWVTSALTTAIKRTDFFLDFTKRYHQIRTDAHNLDNRVKAEPHPEDEGDARQIYFRLFGLMYDEVNAYQNGFLAKSVLIDWMTWQMYDHMDTDFKIGGMSYDNGWRWWLTTPGRHHSYTPMLEAIFACKNQDCVKGAIESHVRPSWF
jgi:hypothetical protein